MHVNVPYEVLYRIEIVLESFTFRVRHGAVPVYIDMRALRIVNKFFNHTNSWSVITYPDINSVIAAKFTYFGKRFANLCQLFFVIESRIALLSSVFIFLKLEVITIVIFS